MKVLIITNDEIFSRMLFLEISAFGAEVSVFTSFCAEAQKEAETADFTVIDAKTPEIRKADISDFENTQVILFGYEDELAELSEKLPSGFRVFTRPFSIRKFLSCIFERNEDSMIGVRPVKRRKTAADMLILGEKSHTVSYKKETSELTKREFELLRLLIERKGEIITREEATRIIWGKTEENETNIVDVYIRYLREKLDEKFGIKIITTVRGKGYTIKSE